MPNPQCSIPRSTTSRDHNQQLHQALVDIARGGGLHNKHILVTDRLADGEGRFLVRVVERNGPGDLDAESAGVRC